MKKSAWLGWGLWGCLVAWAGAAEAIQAYPIPAGQKVTLDGKLDEDVWRDAPPMDEFWELFPQDKVKARVRTEARFAFDKHALYVAVKSFDPDMTQLREPFARRDNVLADQDMIVLFVDPVGTRKFAHFFRVNPRGSIGDGLYNEDTGNEDFSPDFEFEVVTGKFDGGWTAEFRIPFSSLRYGDPPSSTWSVLVFRNYPRDQRYRIASAPLPREQNCFICLNNPLTGLTELPSADHLQVTPLLTARTTRDKVVGSYDRTDREVVPSLDIKWKPRPDTIVDATINPDFSQVELDTPQLAGNTQFALFFPEKRPFFLEGADILQAPFNAMYTRSVTDPSWGARATQRSDKFDGTVLVTRDDGGGLVLLPNTFGTNFALQDFKSMASFARGRWQVGGATAGVVATDRTLEDNRGYNRVLGPDVAWFPNAEHRIRAQVLESWTTALPNAEGRLVKQEEVSGHAGLVDWRFSNAKWDAYLNLEDVAGGFRADNGFFSQSGYRRIYSETSRKFLEAWGFNEVTPYLNAEYKTDREGTPQTQYTNLGLRFGLPRATTLAMEWRPNNNIAVQKDGGMRKRDQMWVSIESNPWPWLSRFYTEVAFGDRVDVANNRTGRGAYIGTTANFRPHPRLEFEYRIDNDWIDSLEPVEGSKRILAQRAQQVLAYWHFTARDAVRTIWQSNWIRRSPSLWNEPVSSREKSDTLSVVYGHRRGLYLTFYVGATFGRTEDADSGFRRYQSEVFAKGSWTFDVF
ncbi:hypothetical protein BWI17_11920 [Betaproteobacteria bacterium GR16-43]|nr:hypothetical protein BWI17_11920 [Betaproteobacteria bacterium GR16-43]